MKKKAAKLRTKLSVVVLAAAAMSVSGCGLQSIPKAKNAVDAAQAEVLNQYQRRADLIPNLVEIVKGAAAQEKETLEAVVNARAKATQMQVNLNDAASLQKFQQAQSELGSALARLLVVSENYPQLKAMDGFRDLQVQLEGTENRITVARQRTIAAIQEFNNQVTVFPTNLTNSVVYHYQPLPQWGADKDVKSLEQAPKVDFKK
ncbi:MAG: putative lipoprotein [Pseudomonadota bacterium]|jgi:LemA protein